MANPGSSKPKGTKTRGKIKSKLQYLVGAGKEFNPSEVPTLRAAIQRGLLIRERLLWEEGRAKKDIPTLEVVQELAVLIQLQWQKSNPKFSPPVTIQEYSLIKKLQKLWIKVEGVALKRGRKGERRKVMAMLDQVLDITTCSHKILLCDEAGSECKGKKACKVKAHIKCSCPLKSKVPVLELLWLAKQRAKRGEKSGMGMDKVDKVETKRQHTALKRKSEEVEAELKRQRKLEEETEMLLTQQAAAGEFLAELDEVEIVQGGREANDFDPGSAKSKKQDSNECRKLVDALLDDRLGDKAGLVTRYLDRPQSKSNTMSVLNTARASMRLVQN